MRRAVDAEDPAPLRRVQEDARAAAGVAEWMQRGIRTVPDCSEASGPASCTGVHSSASWVDSIHKGATEVKTTGMGMADGRMVGNLRAKWTNEEGGVYARKQDPASLRFTSD